MPRSNRRPRHHAPRHRAPHWEIEYKIPVATIVTFICAIALQTGGAIWWARGIDQRVSQLEERVVMYAPQSDRLTRVETRLDGIGDDLKDVKALLQYRVATANEERKRP